MSGRLSWRIILQWLFKPPVENCCALYFEVSPVSCFIIFCSAVFESESEKECRILTGGTLSLAQVKNENGMMSLYYSSSNADSANGNNSEFQVPSIEDNEYLHGMMEKTLIKRYQVVQENMKLKFSLRPIEAELSQIFAVPVPGLTREIVNDNPYLRGALYRLHMTYDENGFDEHYFDLLADFAKNGGAEKRTIIAEALIKCYEFFQVKDASSGLVVQGMEDGSEEEEVVHIVRFEIVTDESQDGAGRKIGNWKIIDVDDLLEGNMFH
jgi:hypothetical protein